MPSKVRISTTRSILNIAIRSHSKQVAVTQSAGLGLEALAVGICEAALMAGDVVDVRGRADHVLAEAVGGVVTGCGG